eukprot:TRINITY_DN61694_c0_g1_i1.p1 TRINITY_DN61694_c0_g1~~TRINITY_DN61694_c0_g1_i1.p1  ORF type:complete len:318 (-),score=68.65 TRINITY_DN61694_c0_g1_i1:113-1066(-)
MLRSLVGSEMCIRDSCTLAAQVVCSSHLCSKGNGAQPTQLNAPNLLISRMSPRTAQIFMVVQWALAGALITGVVIMNNFATSRYNVEPAEWGEVVQVPLVATGVPSPSACVDASKRLLCGNISDGNTYSARWGIFNLTGGRAEFHQDSHQLSLLGRCQLSCSGSLCSDTSGSDQSGYDKHIREVSSITVQHYEDGPITRYNSGMAGPRQFIGPRMMFFWQARVDSYSFEWNVTFYDAVEAHSVPDLYMACSQVSSANFVVFQVVHIIMLVVTASMFFYKVGALYFLRKCLGFAHSGDDNSLHPVSYTHLTLPTKRIV